VSIVRRFGGTAAAYGISSVCTFALTIVVARTLSESDVALVGLVLAAGTLAAAVGAGIDSAAARTVVRSGAAGGLFARAARLRFGCLAATLVLLAGYLVHAVRPLGAGWVLALALGCMVAYAAGSSAAYLLCYEPQAHGNTRRQAAVQASFAFPVLLAVVVAVALGLGVGGVLAALVLGSAPAACWLGWKYLHSRSSPAEGGAAFRSLAAALTIGTVSFAVYQRLDLLWVGATRASGDVAQYAVANRVVSGFSLLTATLVIVGLPTVGAASTRSEALRGLARLRVPVIAVGGALAACVALAPLAVPLVFGAGYTKAGVLTSLLLLQYAPLLTYSLINIPLPFICGRRTVVLQAVILVAVEAAWLVVWRGADLTVLALAPLAGQCAAAAFTWFQFTRADAGGALGIAEART
jgi:O-antigen/teichoic acid export membrane protein